MGRSHSLLSQSRWEGISLKDLLHEELEPYAHSDAAARLDGPDVILTPKSALALSLAIHELATNAAKYGALSSPDGRVAVDWRLPGAGGITLCWRESGGPPVAPPQRRGFGSTLIEQALAMETDGRATVRYLPAGVVCEVFLPSSSILHTGGEANGKRDDPPADPGPPAAMPLRVLVVEDSFLVASALELVFEGFGWDFVGPATRLPRALQLARTEAVDVALLDINLDGEMTWEVAAVLKSRGIPFVFSSGYNGNMVLPAHLAQSPFVTKPYRLDMLEQELRKAIAGAKH
jgi:CheY-like chemotaxis protein